MFKKIKLLYLNFCSKHWKIYNFISRFFHSKQKCVWLLGGVECSGYICKQLLFNGQVGVRICEAHLKAHNDVMRLHGVGMRVEDVLMLSPEEREAKVKRIQ